MIEVVDDPIVVSWSEVDAMRQCPYKHHLAYRERWSTDVPAEPLARGTAWHEILEARYRGLRTKAKKPDHKTIDSLLGVGQDQTERQELLEWMYDGYCEMFDEADREWTIREVEWKGFAPLPNPSGEPSRFMLKVKIDLIAVHRGKLWIWDHKSGRNLPSDLELDLDDQFGLYMWCIRQVGFPVMGSIHNCARTQRNQSPMRLEDRFKRTRLTRTDIELDTIAAEAYATLDKAWPEGGIVRVPERAPDTDRCRWRCGFTEGCLSSRKGGRLEDMLRAHGYQPQPFRDVEIEWKEHKSRS